MTGKRRWPTPGMHSTAPATVEGRSATEQADDRRHPMRQAERPRPGPCLPSWRSRPWCCPSTASTAASCDALAVCVVPRTLLPRIGRAGRSGPRDRTGVAPVSRQVAGPSASRTADHRADVAPYGPRLTASGSHGSAALISPADVLDSVGAARARPRLPSVTTRQRPQQPGLDRGAVGGSFEWLGGALVSGEQAVMRWPPDQLVRMRPGGPHERGAGGLHRFGVCETGERTTL